MSHHPRTVPVATVASAIAQASVLALSLLAGCSGRTTGSREEGTVQLVRPAVAHRSSGVFVTQDDRLVLAVNPDQNTVSIFDAQYDQLPRVCEIPVGEDPRSVTALPTGTKAYVANAGSGTVSVIDLPGKRVVRTIGVGTEPRGLCATPNGTRVYVVNAISNTLTCIDATVDQVLWQGVLPSDRGSQPRSLAITDDHDSDDLDEKIYVPLFFAGLRAGKTGLDEGQDDNRQGTVVVVATATNSIVNAVALSPIAATGFRSNGSVLDLVGTSNGTGGTNAPDPTNPPTVTFDTGCFPNQLAAIALHPTNGKAYVVSTGASPNGPFGFNVNAQGMVSVFDTTTDQEVVGNASTTVHRRAPLNLNQGIPQDTTNQPRLFLTNPVDVVWNRDGSEAWIAIQNSDLLVRMTVDANGLPTIDAPVQAGASAITRIDLRAVAAGQLAGKAPRSMAFNGRTDRLFVYNFVSRSLSVVDVVGRRIAATAESAPLPLPGTPDATVNLGAELFFTGRGPQGRMSSDSWGACIVCHPDGLTDNITWLFPAGPRNTVSLDGMFSRTNTHDQRILNWSALRDENQDFELNTRNVFGGRGLIEDDRILMAIGGALGGTPSDSPVILEYHQALNQFSSNGSLANQPLPALPSARRDHGAAALPDGRIVVVGGRAGAGDGALMTTDAVVCFDPRTNQIRTCSSVGFTPRHSLGVAAVPTANGPRVLAIGGYTATAASTSPTALVQEYDPRTDTWRDVAPLPSPLAEFGTAVSGPLNKAEPIAEVHVVGGNAGSSSGPSVRGAVLRYAPDPVGLGAWRTLAFSITPRRNLGAAAVVRGVFPTHVFAMGGRDASGVATALVESYPATTSQAAPTDPTALIATPITQLPAPRHSFAIGTSNNRIYLAGGVDQAGADLASTLEFNPGANPTTGPVGAPGTPAGVFTAKANLPAAIRSLTLSSPAVVANFQPVRSANRDPRQDAIAEWVKRAVRSNIAPNRGSVAAPVIAGRALFQQPGLTGVTGVSCASCHGGSKWTRSIVDYDAPSSPDLARGFEEITGAELRRTRSQPQVLFDVGTFVAAGRIQEARFNPADVGVRVAALGANGFNIPSLLSVHSTGPYFHSGIAQSLDEVLNGSFDGNGTSPLRSVHNVTHVGARASLIEFLKSIDETAPIVP